MAILSPITLNLPRRLGKAWQACAPEAVGLGNRCTGLCGAGCFWTFALSEVWPGGIFALFLHLERPPPHIAFSVWPAHPLPLPPQRKLLRTLFLLSLCLSSDSLLTGRL